MTLHCCLTLLLCLTVRQSTAATTDQSLQTVRPSTPATPDQSLHAVGEQTGLDDHDQQNVTSATELPLRETGLNNNTRIDDAKDATSQQPDVIVSDDVTDSNIAAPLREIAEHEPVTLIGEESPVESVERDAETTDARRKRQMGSVLKGGYKIGKRTAADVVKEVREALIFSRLLQSRIRQTQTLTPREGPQPPAPAPREETRQTQTPTPHEGPQPPAVASRDGTRQTQTPTPHEGPKLPAVASLDETAQQRERSRVDKRLLVFEPQDPESSSERYPTEEATYPGENPDGYPSFQSVSSYQPERSSEVADDDDELASPSSHNSWQDPPVLGGQPSAREASLRGFQHRLEMFEDNTADRPIYPGGGAHHPTPHSGEDQVFLQDKDDEEDYPSNEVSGAAPSSSIDAELSEPRTYPSGPNPETSSPEEAWVYNSLSADKPLQASGEDPWMTFSREAPGVTYFEKHPDMTSSGADPMTYARENLDMFYSGKYPDMTSSREDPAMTNTRANPDMTYPREREYPDMTYSREREYPDMTYSRKREYPDMTYSREREYPDMTYSREREYPDMTYSREREYPDMTYSGEREYPDMTYSGEREYPDMTYSQEDDRMTPSRADPYTGYNADDAGATRLGEYRVQGGVPPLSMPDAYWAVAGEVAGMLEQAQTLLAHPDEAGHPPQQRTPTLDGFIDQWPTTAGPDDRSVPETILRCVLELEEYQRSCQPPRCLSEEEVRGRVEKCRDVAFSPETEAEPPERARESYSPDTPDFHGDAFRGGSFPPRDSDAGFNEDFVPTGRFNEFDDESDKKQSEEELPESVAEFIETLRTAIEGMVESKLRDIRQETGGRDSAARSPNPFTEHTLSFSSREALRDSPFSNRHLPVDSSSDYVIHKKDHDPAQEDARNRTKRFFGLNWRFPKGFKLGKRIRKEKLSTKPSGSSTPDQEDEGFSLTPKDDSTPAQTGADLQGTFSEVAQPGADLQGTFSEVAQPGADLQGTFSEVTQSGADLQGTFSEVAHSLAELLARLLDTVATREGQDKRVLWRNALSMTQTKRGSAPQESDTSATGAVLGTDREGNSANPRASPTDVSGSDNQKTPTAAASDLGAALRHAFTQEDADKFMAVYLSNLEDKVKASFVKVFRQNSHPHQTADEDKRVLRGRATYYAAVVNRRMKALAPELTASLPPNDPNERFRTWLYLGKRALPASGGIITPFIGRRRRRADQGAGFPRSYRPWQYWSRSGWYPRSLVQLDKRGLAAKGAPSLKRGLAEDAPNEKRSLHTASVEAGLGHPWEFWSRSGWDPSSLFQFGKRGMARDASRSKRDLHSSSAEAGLGHPWEFWSRSGWDPSSLFQFSKRGLAAKDTPSPREYLIRSGWYPSSLFQFGKRGTAKDASRAKRDLHSSSAEAGLGHPWEFWSRSGWDPSSLFQFGKRGLAAKDALSPREYLIRSGWYPRSLFQFGKRGMVEDAPSDSPNLHASSAEAGAPWKLWNKSGWYPSSLFQFGKRGLAAKDAPSPWKYFSKSRWYPSNLFQFGKRGLGAKDAPREKRDLHTSSAEGGSGHPWEFWSRSDWDPSSLFQFGKRGITKDAQSPWEKWIRSRWYPSSMFQFGKRGLVKDAPSEKRSLHTYSAEGGSANPWEYWSRSGWYPGNLFQFGKRGLGAKDAPRKKRDLHTSPAEGGSGHPWEFWSRSDWDPSSLFQFAKRGMAGDGQSPWEKWIRSGWYPSSRFHIGKRGRVKDAQSPWEYWSRRGWYGPSSLFQFGKRGLAAKGASIHSPDLLTLSAEAGSERRSPDKRFFLRTFGGYKLGGFKLGKRGQREGGDAEMTHAIFGNVLGGYKMGKRGKINGDFQDPEKEKRGFGTVLKGYKIGKRGQREEGDAEMTHALFGNVLGGYKMGKRGKLNGDFQDPEKDKRGLDKMGKRGRINGDVQDPEEDKRGLGTVLKGYKFGKREDVAFEKESRGMIRETRMKRLLRTVLNSYILKRREATTADTDQGRDTRPEETDSHGKGDKMKRLLLGGYKMGKRSYEAGGATTNVDANGLPWAVLGDTAAKGRAGPTTQDKDRRRKRFFWRRWRYTSDVDHGARRQVAGRTTPNRGKRSESNTLFNHQPIEKRQEVNAEQNQTFVPERPTEVEIPFQQTDLLQQHGFHVKPEVNAEESQTFDPETSKTVEIPFKQTGLLQHNDNDVPGKPEDFSSVNPNYSKLKKLATELRPKRPLWNFFGGYSALANRATKYKAKELYPFLKRQFPKYVQRRLVNDGALRGDRESREMNDGATRYSREEESVDKSFEKVTTEETRDDESDKPFPSSISGLPKQDTTTTTHLYSNPIDEDSTPRPGHVIKKRTPNSLLSFDDQVLQAVQLHDKTATSDNSAPPAPSPSMGSRPDTRPSVLKEGLGEEFLGDDGEFEHETPKRFIGKIFGGYNFGKRTFLTTLKKPARRHQLFQLPGLINIIAYLKARGLNTSRLKHSSGKPTRRNTRGMQRRPFGDKTFSTRFPFGDKTFNTRSIFMPMKSWSKILG